MKNTHFCSKIALQSATHDVYLVTIATDYVAITWKKEKGSLSLSPDFRGGIVYFFFFYFFYSLFFVSSFTILQESKVKQDTKSLNGVVFQPNEAKYIVSFT